MADKGFTPKQQKFIELFNGNATEAARLAGYTGSDSVLGKTGFDLLRNPKIHEAIEKRSIRSMKHHIATREERQAFWTQVMLDAAEEMPMRLKASELLGKSFADFTEKIEHSGAISLGELILGSMKDKDADE